jgi:hypothetical protein
LPADTLASIVNELQEIIGSDEVTDEEQQFVDTVMERWEIEAGEEEAE